MLKKRVPWRTKDPESLVYHALEGKILRNLPRKSEFSPLCEEKGEEEKKRKNPQAPSKSFHGGMKKGVPFPGEKPSRSSFSKGFADF